jgi:hypothetical protein
MRISLSRIKLFLKSFIVTFKKQVAVIPPPRQRTKWGFNFSHIETTDRTLKGTWMVGRAQKPRSRLYRAGIFKEAMGARNRRGRGLSYWPARLHRLAEYIPWNRFRGPIHV